MTIVLGVSAFYHDAAAALIIDGVVVAAAQEERFTRIKNDPSFPINAIKYLLMQAGVSSDKIDYCVFYEKPFLHFERLLETYIVGAPRGFEFFRKSIPVWLKEKLFQKKVLFDSFEEAGVLLNDSQLLFSEHHMSHAASAFYPSPFEKAAIITIDGVGEWSTTSLAIGSGSEIQVIKELHFPHSLGLLYSAFTYYLGFKVNDGEYKIMGLAPYGKPIYADLILSKLLDLKEDGSFRLNMKYFNYLSGMTMTNKRFERLFVEPRRSADDVLDTFHMDMAASIQSVTEKIVLRICRAFQRETGLTNLCLAGGVALNCVANGKLVLEKVFEQVWVQPASGDAGGAVGSALMAYHAELSHPRVPVTPDGMQGAFLGPEFSTEQVVEVFKELGVEFKVLDDDHLFDEIAREINEGKVIGWFQGRMEFGPRALGARSIIADARSPDMQKTLNLKVKRRESFRPFAPAVLEEDVGKWFELDDTSPYMTIVSRVHEEQRINSDGSAVGLDRLKTVRSNIPAVTHVDDSARVQTVHLDTNPRLYALISSFKRISGCPVVINTSFNVKDEPIVCDPKDAYSCFKNTDIDILVCQNVVVRK